MGFFGKLKSAVNVVTGGAAKVNVEFNEATFGESLIVTINATTKAECKVDKVYLKFRGVEEIELEDTDYSDRDGDGDTERTSERIHRSHTTFETEYVVSGPQEIGEDESVQWQFEVPMPEHLQPTYRGHYCSHQYEVQAGLDMFGNDPDSGWVDVPFIR